MATIARLQVAVTANTKRFQKGMKSAKRSLHSFGDSVKRGILRIGAYGAAISGIAGPAALGYLIKRQMSVVDSTAKMSKALGIGIDSLDGLRHAAELNGASSDMLDKSMKKMARSIGEVATLGTGEAKDAFEAMGLSSEALLGMSPEEQFLAIADGMKILGTQTAKAAVASKIFGRSGVDLINTLDKGKRGLRGIIDENVRLQGSLSRIDAQKIEDANDAVERMGRAFTGIMRKLAVTVAPVIENIATSMANGFVALRGKITDAFVGILEGINTIDQSGAIAAFVNGMKGGFEGIVAVGKILYGTIQGIAGLMLKAAATAERAWIMFTGKDAIESAERDLKVYGKNVTALTEMSQRDFGQHFSANRGSEFFGMTREEALAAQRAKYNLAQAEYQGLQEMMAGAYTGEGGMNAQAEAMLDAAEKRINTAIPEALDALQKGMVSGAMIPGIDELIAKLRGVGGSAGDAYAKPFWERFGKVGEKKIDEISKAAAIGTPAALERGSAGAYSVGVRAQVSSQDKVLRDTLAVTKQTAKVAETQRTEQTRILENVLGQWENLAAGAIN